MEDCLGDNSTVKPVFTFYTSWGSSSSSSTRSSTPDEGLNSDSSDSEEREGCSSSKLKRPKRKRKSKSSASEMLDFLKDYTAKREKVEEEKVNILKAMQEEKKSSLVSFFSFLKDSKKEWVSLEEQHWSEYFGIMYLSILIPRVCHPKEIKRGMDRRSVVWNYLLQNSSIVMGYPLGKVAWLWLFLIQNILGLFQHMSGTDPGEVKWVNFHSPTFFWAPFFLFFSYPSNIEIIFDCSDFSDWGGECA